VGQTKHAFVRIGGLIASFGSSKDNQFSVTICTKSVADKLPLNDVWLNGAGLRPSVTSPVYLRLLTY
jgi:enamine deaminase RidA (YjgF/YER057c/UK114 family)